MTDDPRLDRDWKTPPDPAALLDFIEAGHERMKPSGADYWDQQTCRVSFEWTPFGWRVWDTDAEWSSTYRGHGLGATWREALADLHENGEKPDTCLVCQGCELPEEVIRHKLEEARTAQHIRDGLCGCGRCPHCNRFVSSTDHHCVKEFP